MDEAIRRLSDALDNRDIEKVEAFRRSISDRIDELEEFYLRNDDGPCVALVATLSASMEAPLSSDSPHANKHRLAYNLAVLHTATALCH